MQVSRINIVTIIACSMQNACTYALPSMGAGGLCDSLGACSIRAGFRRLGFRVYLLAACAAFGDALALAAGAAAREVEGEGEGEDATSAAAATSRRATATAGRDMRWREGVEKGTQGGTRRGGGGGMVNGR